MKYLIALIAAATLPIFGAEHTNAAVKKGLTGDLYSLLPPMTQEEIVARLKAATASTKAGPR